MPRPIVSGQDGMLHSGRAVLPAGGQVSKSGRWSGSLFICGISHRIAPEFKRKILTFQQRMFHCVAVNFFVCLFTQNLPMNHFGVLFSHMTEKK